MASNFNGKIRLAKELDIPRIREIYDVHTSDITSVVSFEEKTPSINEMTLRWKEIRENHLPFLVCEIDEILVGYAYATKFRSRASYRHTVEESVYVAEEYQGRGIGRALILAVIDQCKHIGVRCVLAVLGTEGDNPSKKLHRKIGFQDVGILHDVGYKNGKWVGRLIMEYIIK